MLMSIHVVGQVTCEILEKLDLGPQLQLHLEHETRCRTPVNLLELWTRLGGPP